jgi:hypothetical protein
MNGETAMRGCWSVQRRCWGGDAVVEGGLVVGKAAVES